jgi:hypothetical protein
VIGVVALTGVVKLRTAATTRVTDPPAAADSTATPSVAAARVVLEAPSADAPLPPLDEEPNRMQAAPAGSGAAHGKGAGKAVATAAVLAQTSAPPAARTPPAAAADPAALRAAPRTPPPAAAVAAPAPAPKPAVNCDPPWVMGSDGIKHWKDECTK